MKKLRKNFFTNGILLLVAVMGLMCCASCSKDDEPDQPTSSKNELVGTWYFSGDGSVDQQDCFKFKSNGTGTWYYYGDIDDFTYTYDSNSKILILKFWDGDTDVVEVEWLGNNTIILGNEGMYIRE